MEKKDVTMELDISEYSNFELEKAICNHGFFMMPPNQWIAETKTFKRPIRLNQNSYQSLVISISQSSKLSSLLIRVHTQSLTSAHRRIILDQVRRMLRLSEKDEKDVREFQKIHEEAKEKGFGRLFRSPSLFEDIVKSILLCHCSWNNSLQMAAALCDTQPLLASMLQDRMDNAKSIIETKETKKSPPIKKRKHHYLCSELDSHYEVNPIISSSTQNFPTSKELIMVDKAFLKKKCKLGYRAQNILRLARQIENGKLKLDELDRQQSHEQVITKLLKIKGIGPFTNSSILVCLGFYHQVPTDTETIRLVKKVHGKEDCCNKNINKYATEIYARYEPFQCLAYWVELLNDYETRFGKLSEMSSSCYHTVNGRNDIIMQG